MSELFSPLRELRRSLFVMSFGELIGTIDLNSNGNDDDVQSDLCPKGTPSWWKYEEDWNVESRRFMKRGPSF
jgi:hypothetical protein